MGVASSRSFWSGSSESDPDLAGLGSMQTVCGQALAACAMVSYNGCPYLS